MMDGFRSPFLILLAAVVLTGITACTALRPGVDEYALTGRMGEARQGQDAAPSGQDPQLRSAWLQWHDGDLLAAIRSLDGKLPQEWTPQLASWLGEQEPALQDSLFALADHALPMSLQLSRQWLQVREREGLPMPDSLLLRLSHLPEERFLLAARGGSDHALLEAMRVPGLMLSRSDLAELGGRSASCQLQMRRIWLDRVGPLEKKDRLLLAEAELWHWLVREYKLLPPTEREEEYLQAIALASSGHHGKALQRFRSLPEGYRDTSVWVDWLVRVEADSEDAASGRTR